GLPEELKSIQFVQDNEAKSTRGVLRGLHYQLPPFAQSKDEVDICSEGDVHRIIDENKPNYVINCAAYTAVDKAETEVDQ
ncbi:unnamed protein product, partial [Darwinula stevensoni]